MATTYKVLGQIAPTATTNTNVYTVPASTETVVSTIFVCNRGATAATYRIAIRKNGNSISNEHYLAYDALILANDAVAITVGCTLDAADVITVYASTASLSFNVFGSEITA
jgi:hypothetical protein